MVLRATEFRFEELGHSFYDGMTPHDLRLLLGTIDQGETPFWHDGADELGLKI